MLVLAGSASAASTVTFTPRDYFNGQEEEPDEFDPSFVEVTGDDGANVVALTLSGTVVTVGDTSGLTAGAGCTQVNATSATCPLGDASYVYAKGGDDRVGAQPALETEVEGDAGNDEITTAGPIRAGDGRDELTANGGDPTLDGEAGDDTLTGGAGDETMFGGAGSDDLVGGAGNDRLDGDDPEATVFEKDSLDGGDGFDVLAWSSRRVAVQVDLSTPAPDGADGENDKIDGIEALETGSGDDTLIGSDAAELFEPGAGRDNVSGGGGDDFADASDGSDTFDLGAGSDTISFRLSEEPVTVNLADPGPDGPKSELDTLVGGENVIGSEPDDDTKGDTLIGDENANILTGLLGSDRLTGGGGNDQLYGEGRPIDVAGGLIDLSYPAKDRLSGGDGEDLLVGGIDSDRLDGGLGNDRIIGDVGPGFGRGNEPRSAGSIDVVDYSSRSSRVTARVGSGGGEGSEADTYAGIEGIRGGRGNDVLTGRRGKKDLLWGGRGNDRLNGRSGKDKLRGQAGADRLLAKDGKRDLVDCGKGRDRFRADRRDKRRSCERRI
jgi:Ca2+-binding RTX toxin-like protein